MAGLLDSMKIARVKVLGVRTAMHSGVFTNVNYGIYSLLVQYIDGHVELIEADYNKMKKYVPYIEWPYPSES